MNDIYWVCLVVLIIFAVIFSIFIEYVEKSRLKRLVSHFRERLDQLTKERDKLLEKLAKIEKVLEKNE